MGMSFMEKQMSSILDERMMRIISEYREWCDATPREIKHLEAYVNGRAEMGKKVFHIAKLKTIGDEELCELLLSSMPNLKAGPCRTMHRAIRDNREKFIRAVEHLNTIDEARRFVAIEDFLNGKFKIKGLGKAFWGEVIRCKFPSIALVNGKTERFFDALGIRLGVTTGERCENATFCHSRWSSLWAERTGSPKLSLLEMSHLEHFALKESGSFHDHP